MNRTGMTWASAVAAIGALMAGSGGCADGGNSGSSSSSGTDRDGGGGDAPLLVTGPSCPSGAMAAAMGPPPSAECDECVQKYCTTAWQNAGSACAPFSNCYCPCAATDDACHGMCRARLSMDCTTSFGRLVGCEIVNCIGTCSAMNFDGGSGGD
jgi:hypothetical protein